MSPAYSLIIPAFNEAHYLPQTLAKTREAMQKVELPGELIVVDNNSSDRTAEIARQAGAQLVHEPINQISRARNAGARRAAGQYLVFLDADSELSADLLTKALANLAGGEVCGGGARVRFGKEVQWLPQRVLDFWNWYSRTWRCAAGCFLYCLREAFDEVGGFSESVYASEEIWLSMALRKWGKGRGMEFRIITGYPVITSDRKLRWHSSAGLVLQSLPILICPPLLRVQYFCKHWYSRPPNES